MSFPNSKIDVEEFLEARSKEINGIEKSISTKNKKSLLFQRLPFYKRRRNRNYDKISRRKFTGRKKDRHFLRSHTYFAKRFFMMKLVAPTKECFFARPKTELNGSDNLSVLDSGHDREIKSVDDCVRLVSKTGLMGDSLSPFNFPFSIPIKRRIKSSKFIYKSKSRGYLFDESFRGIFAYNKSQIKEIVGRNTTSNDIGRPNLNLLDYINNSSESAIEYFDNEFEIIVDGNVVISIGRRFPGMSELENQDSSALNCGFIEDNKRTGLLQSVSDTYLSSSCHIEEKPSVFNSFYGNSNFKDSLCSLSIIKDKFEGTLPESSKYKIFHNRKSSTGSMSTIETAKIICHRNHVMEIIQKLSNVGLIPVCLEEIDRIALECDKMTVYDNINSTIYRLIECERVAEIMKLAANKPKGKRNGLEIACLKKNIRIVNPKNKKNSVGHGHHKPENGPTAESSLEDGVECIFTTPDVKNSEPIKHSYFIFSVDKGDVQRYSEIFTDDFFVGRVIRCGFKYTSGKMYGLGVLFEDVKETTLFVRNIGLSIYYQIEIENWV